MLCFALSASVMALVGAVLSLRYPYIDANIAFNNTWSFQVLIAALLGGPDATWGPAVGAIPLVLLSEYLAGTFPHHFGIALGLCFVVIVYFLPGGVAPLLERCYHSLAAPRTSVRPALSHAAPALQGQRRAPRGCGAHETAVASRRPAAQRPRPAQGVRRPGRRARHLLRRAAGGIIGLIGPNGSGKTTVLNLITGELRPDAGAVLLEGEDICRLAVVPHLPRPHRPHLPAGARPAAA